jgi:23S rRNA pseudouridine2605 synthase
LRSKSVTLNNRKPKKSKGGQQRRGQRSFSRRSSKPSSNEPKKVDDGSMRLNRFIAHAGICSRREADTFIIAGSVEVNGKVVSEMGYKVLPGDSVKFDGRLLTPEKMEYVLLNKPKNFLTTTEDDKGRKTVMDLIRNASKSRLLPVGRLDRNTTGLLLFTNDGEMAARLTHPRYAVRKIYHVVLDRALKVSDLQQIEKGVDLDDGSISVDAISYIANATKREVGIEIHSGRNRIIRRIFEHLGYEVAKLDRVMFAGLTKKDLPRGQWRALDSKEVSFLKMIGKRS